MKRILSVVLALALCLSLFACGKQPEAPPANDPPVTETPPAETPPQEPITPPEEPVPADPLPGETVELHVPQVMIKSLIVVSMNADNEKTFQLDLNLPVCESLPIVNNYYEAMRDDLQATYGLNREEAARQLADYRAAGLEFTPWTAQVTATVTRNDGATLSVLREVYENFGGAHPLVTYRAETFDVASQGRLVLGNLFTVSEDEYLSRLKDMILVQMDQKEADSGVAYFDDAREQLLSLLDPMDFALTDDSLLIFYNVYALAPHAAGPQQFYLPLSELSDILNPQWVK